MHILKGDKDYYSPNTRKSSSKALSPRNNDEFKKSFPMKNHTEGFSFDKMNSTNFFAQGDNGGRSHNRYFDKGNDILQRKRKSNMRNIGYGISTSVKPKKLGHLTYDDY